MIRSSIRFVLAALSIAVLAGSVGAALTGRIVDQSGTPLSNAVVKLQSANLADTTAADGQFSFTVSGVLMPAASPLKQAITCANGVISFTISSEAEPVTIRLFDVSGRQVAPSFTQELSPGEYSFDALSLIQGAALGRIFIARVSLDGKMYSYKISFQAGERRRLMGNGRTGDLRASGLAKREAQVDILQISRTGYQNMTMPVSSYDMNLGDITMTAQSYVLTISSNPANGGTVTQNPNLQTYPYSTLVTLTAAPSSGYYFTNWSGNASGTSPSTQIAMTDNMNVTANFSLHILPKYTLTATANPSAGGSVSLSPAGGMYDSGTVVTLTTAASSGYAFASWSGDVSGTSTPAQVAMTGNRSVTANFTPVPIITGPSSATGPFQISCTYNWISTLASNLDQLVLEYSKTSSISGFTVLSSSPAGAHPSSYSFSCIPQAGDVGNFYFRVHVIEAARTTNVYSNVLTVNVTYQSPKVQITNDLHSGTSASGNNWTQLNTVISVKIGAVQDANSDVEVLSASDVNCSLAGGSSIPPGQSMQFDVTNNIPNYYVYVQTGWWDFDVNTYCWNKHYAAVLCSNGTCCCYKWVFVHVTNQNSGVFEIKLSQFLPGGSWNGTF